MLGMGALALTVSGCVFKVSPTAEQVGHKPKVRVTFTLCESDAAPPTDCPNLGNADSDFPDGSTGYLLVAFRVPNGASPPTLLIRKRGDYLPKSTRRNPSRFDLFSRYTRQLNRKAPKRDNERWFGYISDVTNPFKGDEEVGLEGTFVTGQRGIFVPKRMQRALKNGKRRTFRLSVVTGATIASRSEPAEFNCGPDPFDFNNPDSTELSHTICINDPTRRQLRNRIEVRMRP